MSLFNIHNTSELMLTRRATAVVAKTACFEGSNQIWCPRMEDCLNLGGRNLRLLNLCLTLQISHTGCLGLCRVISPQNALGMCSTVWNREKFNKTAILGVQDRSMSLLLVPPESSSAVLVIISSNNIVQNLLTDFGVAENAQKWQNR